MSPLRIQAQVSTKPLTSSEWTKNSLLRNWTPQIDPRPKLPSRRSCERRRHWCWLGGCSWRPVHLGTDTWSTGNESASWPGKWARCHIALQTPRPAPGQPHRSTLSSCRLLWLLGVWRRRGALVPTGNGTDFRGGKYIEHGMAPPFKNEPQIK